MAEDQEEILRYGKRIKAVMTDPDFVKVEQQLRADLVKEWENGRTTIERETTHAKLSGLNAFMLKLKAVADNAQYVSGEINRKPRNPA